MSPEDREELDFLLTAGTKRNPETCPGWFHSGQRKAWASSASDVVAVAGTQGGKTAAQAPWLAREISRSWWIIKMLGERTGSYEGKWIYAGPTLSLMSAQVLPSFRAHFVDEMQWGTLVLGNKPVFRFSEKGARSILNLKAGDPTPTLTVHFAYTNDSSNLESMTALGGVWDEAGQKENKLESFEAFNRRLKVARSAEPPPGEHRMGRRLWGTTPYEWGWFKAMVVDPAIKRWNGFEYFNFPSWLNPFFSKAEADRELENGMPLWKWRMFYEGLFTRPAGAIYDCFDASIHTCPAFKVPEAWPRYVGIDFGNVNTAAVLVAEELRRVGVDRWAEPTGRLFVYRTYKASADDIDNHARQISKGEPRTLSGTGGSHQESGWRQAYRNAGIILSNPAPDVRDVEVGISCAYGAIKRNEIVIFETLRSSEGTGDGANLIDQIEQYSRELDATGEPVDGTIADKASYHYCDAFRYIIAKLRPPTRGCEITITSGITSKR